MTLAHHAALNRELDQVEARLHALESPTPDIHGDAADMQTARQGQEDLVTERARLTETRRRIVSALIRIEEGTYGDCLSCLEPIGAARLAAVPFAELCLSCKATEERTVRTAGQPLDMAPDDEAYR